MLWFDDCSKIGNIGYIVGCQVFSRQHLETGKATKETFQRLAAAT
jgi:hypothetical protein